MNRTYSNFDRQTFVAKNGFVYPQPDLLQYIAGQGPIVSVGAGSGRLERCLADAPYHCDIKATDPYTRNSHYAFKSAEHFPIRKMRATTAIRKHPTRTVLMSWPCYTRTWCEDALHAMHPGQRIIYIGEGHGGCTATDKFHDMLDDPKLFKHISHHYYPQFYGLHDTANTYKRRSFS